MEEESATPPKVDAPPASATITMIRKMDGRINYVLPENVQDYLDSSLWTVEV